jgi:hypothetical protein
MLDAAVEKQQFTILPNHHRLLALLLDPPFLLLKSLKKFRPLLFAMIGIPSSVESVISVSSVEDLFNLVPNSSE